MKTSTSSHPTLSVIKLSIDKLHHIYSPGQTRFNSIKIGYYISTAMSVAYINIMLLEPAL